MMKLDEGRGLEAIVQVAKVEVVDGDVGSTVKTSLNPAAELSLNFPMWTCFHDHDFLGDKQ